MNPRAHPAAKLRARLVAAAAAVLLAGCATQNADPADPLEGLNRAVFGFNEGFDRAIARPVATAYRDVIPDPIRERVRNFFANLYDIWIGANNMLQGKFTDGASDWGRVLWNSSFGLFGLHDVATEWGYEKHNEDFGQTFGRWGVGEGAYLVLPILGPSTLRDTGGTVLDLALDPLAQHHPIAARNAMVLLRATGQRADLLDASRLLEEAALDKYAFQRDAYLQRRRSLIRDGAPAPTSDNPERTRPPVAHGTGSIFEPKIPANYDAVLAAAARTGKHDASR